MQLRYSLDDKPPIKEMVTVNLQWLAVIAPILIIGGRLVADLQYEESLSKTIYLQKVFFISGLALLLQLFLGHRLPLVVGPSAVLMVGIYASLESGFEAIYTAIAVCGAILFIFAISGKLNLLRRFFTENIVAVILLLVALTLTPAIIELLTFKNAFYNLIFSIAFLITLFSAGRRLKGFWNTSLIIWGIIFGSVAYLMIFPAQIELYSLEISSFFSDLNLRPVFRIEVIVAFLICFLALAINDLSSIYSVGEILKAEQIDRRVTWGVSLTGLSNLLSGLFGVVGTVNYTLSPGMISATSCASRYPLALAGSALIVIAFIPAIISLFGSIPSAIIGSVFIYILCSQIGVAISMVKSQKSGAVIGFPILLAVIIAFLPEEVLSSFPEVLRPILGNSFVMGVITAMILEHVVFRGYESP